MSNQDLVEGAIDVSAYGIHLISTKKNERFQSLKKTISDAQHRAERIITDAEQKREKILTDAAAERDKILAAAKKQALEQGAAEIVQFKKAKDQQLLKHLEQVEGKVMTVLEDIITHILSKSGKRDFILSQSMEVFHKHIIQPAIPASATVKGSESMLVDIKEMLETTAPNTLEHLNFAEDSNAAANLTIELEDRILVIDPNAFIEQLKENLAPE